MTGATTTIMASLTRPNDIFPSFGNAAKAEKLLDWRPTVEFAEIVPSRARWRQRRIVGVRSDGAISVSGRGLREGARVSGMSLIGVPEPTSLALSIEFGLVMISGSTGGLFWLLETRRVVPEPQ